MSSTARQATSIDPYYARELSFLAKRPGVTRQDLPKPGGSAEFEVVGIPLTSPVPHRRNREPVARQRAAGDAEADVRAQRRARHQSWRYIRRPAANALVWVTALDSAVRPADGLDVRHFSACTATASGRARPKPGRARRSAADAAQLPRYRQFLFASARLNGDYSFARSDCGTKASSPGALP